MNVNEKIEREYEDNNCFDDEHLNVKMKNALIQTYLTLVLLDDNVFIYTFD